MANNSGSILKKFLSDILFDRFNMFISINGNGNGKGAELKFYVNSISNQFGASP